MTYEDARRKLERSTDFRFEQGGVVVRSQSLLAAVDTLRREDALALRWAERPLSAVRPALRAA